MAKAAPNVFVRLIGRGPADDDEVEFELVFSRNQPAAEISSRLTLLAPQVRFALEPVFQKTGGDQFFFLTYPDLDAKDHETDVFELGRLLRQHLNAEEVNPVFRDSLYGSAAVAPAAIRASSVFGGLCSTTPNSSYPKGWALGAVHAPEAWALTRGANVRVADIDTGYSDHTELAGVFDLDRQANFVEGDTPLDARDRFSTDVQLPNPGHGTLVSSVVASRGGLRPGGTLETTGPGEVTGVAPEALIVPIRAIRSVVDIKQSRLPGAIRHAQDHDCDVVVMCLGGPSRLASVEKAIRDAVDAGMIFVCAAGNCWPSVVFPARYSADRLCVAVAAVGHELKPWKMSAQGSTVTVSAPGENVWGASKTKASDPVDTVQPSQGTTLATSMTAGVAALFVARHGGRTTLLAAAKAKGVTVQDLFMRAVTFDIAPPDVWEGSTTLGAGIVNAERVLAYDINAIQASAARVGRRSAPRAYTPAVDMLRRMAIERKPDADGEVDAAIEDLAPELIWQSFQSGGRERLSVALRASSTPRARAAKVSPPTLTAAAATALSSRPLLRSALGLEVATAARPRAAGPRAKKASPAKRAPKKAPAKGASAAKGQTPRKRKTAAKRRQS